MRKIITQIILFSIAVIVIPSCKKFLDINKNPNSATDATPKLVTANALVVTAANVRAFNSAGSWIAGYTANAGGYSGWGSVVTYNFTTGDHSGIWGNSRTVGLYDNLLDYEYIDSTTNGIPAMAYYNAIAKAMETFGFQMLVDFYGDVPYSEALKGTDKLTPKYDKAEDIYKEMIARLDQAIELFRNKDETAQALTDEDVMFNGDITKWMKFANTLKLRLLIRISKVPSLSAFVSSAFSQFDTNLGFITDDAIINPGYTGSAGKQNPSWDFYHSDPAGASRGQGRQILPTEFVFNFYNGKIEDEARGKAVYRGFPGTPLNQLGFVGTPGNEPPTAPSGAIAWYVGSGTGNTIGLFKGRSAGQPIMLAAESWFLQAEAHLNNYLPGNAKESFNKGIEASFTYLYKNAGNVVEQGYDPGADAAAYITTNAGNALVDYDKAAAEGSEQEAIITQKYIALNFIHGNEAWSEFRRTGFPKITNGSSDGMLTFASAQSASTRSDKLPVRVLYPDSEYQLNPANVPSGVNQFTNLIFWQLK